MKKTLNIGGKEVTFEATVFTLDLYNREFGRDLLADTLIMVELANTLNSKNPSFKKLKNLDTTIILKVAWACAKTADESVPGYTRWLKENPDFNVMTDGMQAVQLAMDQLIPKKN